MTRASPPLESRMRQASTTIARAAVWLVLVLMAAGLVMAWAGAASLSTPVLGLACALLLLVPVVNVLSELADEIGRRDWAFAAAAFVVLALITYSVVSRLG